MRATAMKRSTFNTIKRGIASLGLMILVAGPAGCVKNLSQRSVSKNPQALSQKATESDRTKEFLVKAGLLQKEIGSIEAKLTALQAIKASEELGRVLAMLQKLQNELDVSPLEPLAGEGISVISTIKTLVSKKSLSNVERKKLGEQIGLVERVINDIKGSFEDVRRTQIKKNTAEFEALQKKLRKIQRRGVLRVIYRKRGRMLSGKIEALSSKLKKLQSYEGYFGKSADSKHIERIAKIIQETQKTVAMLRQQLAELRKKERDNAIRKLVNWRTTLRNLRKKTGDGIVLDDQELKAAAEYEVNQRRREILKNFESGSGKQEVKKN